MMIRTPLPLWANIHFARILGISNVVLGQYLNGLSYPPVKTMQKFEVVMGWPVREQVDLIPYYWDWPDAGRYGDDRNPKPQQDPTDLRYSIMLGKVLREWADANPRTESIADLRLHPSLESKGRHFKGRPNGGRKPPEEV